MVIFNKVTLHLSSNYLDTRTDEFSHPTRRKNKFENEKSSGSSNYLFMEIQELVGTIEKFSQMVGE
jgi:hypothetical protein